MSLHVFTILTLSALSLHAVILTTLQAPAPAIALELCRNGLVVFPQLSSNCVTSGGVLGWVRDNADATNSHFEDGGIVPFRALMTDLPVGATIIVDLGYDVRSGGKFPFDFLAAFQPIHNRFFHSEGVFPLSGVSGVPATPVSTFPIPTPGAASSPIAGQPTTAFNALPPERRVMTLYGGTLTAVEYLSQGSLVAETSQTIVRVTFVATNSTAVLAWGGHIAACLDWGTTAGVCNTAGGRFLPGSPYRMRITGWNLSGLTVQERTVAAGAVYSFGRLVIRKAIRGAGNATFEFLTILFTPDPSDPPLPLRIPLTTSGSPGSAQLGPFTVFANARPDGGKSFDLRVSEFTIPPGWFFAGATCDDTDSVVNLQSVDARVSPGETVTCTFENRLTAAPLIDRPRSAGFWRNWSSCTSGNQRPLLDEVLGLSPLVVSATVGVLPSFGGTRWLVLQDTNADPERASNCEAASRLLNRSTIDAGDHRANDPAFNLAAQLLAALLNHAAGAPTPPAVMTTITQAVLLLGKYAFDGTAHADISSLDAATMHALADTLEQYNSKS